VKRWLLGPSDDTTHDAGRQALFALNIVLSSLRETDEAIRRLRWRRLGLLSAIVVLAAALALAVVLIIKPSSGPDLAEGKPWQASSSYPGYTVSGLKPKNPTEGAFFCTKEDVEPWWRVDLQGTKSIASATVVNRGDCCVERAPPLVIEVSTDGQKWREVSRTTEAFRTWSPTFKATNARYVRLRSLRKTYLHLKDVRIHPPKG
jgi:hypothetical protein